MAKPIAVMYADGHMARGAWAHRPINGDAEFSLRQIINKAIDLDVPVLGAGDLIDKAKVMSWPVTAMFKQLDKLQRVGLRLLYIRGQHEGQSDFLAAHPAADSLDCGAAVELPTGRMVYGIDYQPIGDLQRRLNTEVDDAIDVLLLHQVWDNLMGSIACPQGAWGQIPGVGFVLTGDYHDNYVDEKVTCEDGHELRVINPGSVCMQSISEPPAKYFCVLYDDMSVEKIQLRTRHLLTTDLIYNDELLEEFVGSIGPKLEDSAEKVRMSGLPDPLRKPLLRVEYNADVTNAKRRIEKCVDGRAHLFLKQRPISRPEVLERLEQRKHSSGQHATTLESELGPYLKKIDKVHLGPRCQRLLQVDNAFAELVAMKDEYINQE